MSEFEILQRAGLAAAIGLLIGIERGWQTRSAKDGSRVAGVRTFTLIGGSESLMHDLLASREVECLPVNPETRVDRDADLLGVPQ